MIRCVLTIIQVNDTIAVVMESIPPLDKTTKMEGDFVVEKLIPAIKALIPGKCEGTIIRKDANHDKQ